MPWKTQIIKWKTFLCCKNLYERQNVTLQKAGERHNWMKDIINIFWKTILIFLMKDQLVCLIIKWKTDIVLYERQYFHNTERLLQWKTLTIWHKPHMKDKSVKLWKTTFDWVNKIKWKTSSLNDINCLQKLKDNSFKTLLKDLVVNIPIRKSCGVKSTLHPWSCVLHSEGWGAQACGKIREDVVHVPNVVQYVKLNPRLTLRKVVKRCSR